MSAIDESHKALKDGVVPLERREELACEMLAAERREARKLALGRGMAAAMSSEFVEHPLPWTWTIAFHDGWFIQFIDASGSPVLDDSMRDPETAANLLRNINSKIGN